MSAQNTNLNRRWTRIAVLILALITALIFPHLSFAQKKKNAPTRMADCRSE